MTEAIAVVAVAVAILTALLAWVQNNRLSDRVDAVGRRADRIQERLAVVEEDRRRSELEPRIKVEFVSEPTYGFRFINDGPSHYNQIEVILVRPASEESPIEALLGPAPGDAATISPLRMGEASIIAATRHPDERGGPARFLLRCTSISGEQWEVVASAEVPPSPHVHVW